jgi:hypothetical protein
MAQRAGTANLPLHGGQVGETSGPTNCELEGATAIGRTCPSIGHQVALDPETQLTGAL